MVIRVQVEQPYIDNVATRVTYDGWDRIFGIEWQVGRVSGRLEIPDASVTEDEVFADILDRTNAGVSVPERYTPFTAPRLLPYLLAVREKWGHTFNDHAHASMGMALIAMVATMRPTVGPVVAPTVHSVATTRPPVKATSEPSLPPARASTAAPRASTKPAAPSATGSTVSAVWSRPPAVRGREIESALGANLPPNFPTIDKFEGGVVTSIKSLDLGAKSYQNVGALTSKVKGYIDKVAKFDKAIWGGVKITPDEVKQRALDLVVPSAGTAAQQAALKKLVADGLSVGVEVNIIVY